MDESFHLGLQEFFTGHKEEKKHYRDQNRTCLHSRKILSLTDVDDSDKNLFLKNHAVDCQSCQTAIQKIAQLQTIIERNIPMPNVGGEIEKQFSLEIRDIFKDFKKNTLKIRKSFKSRLIDFFTLGIS